ncbi:hypothetical protein [Luteimonas sp. A649]
MRILTFLTLLSLVVSTACRAADSYVQPERVLFVGNSLTYVGNVPAIYSALAVANGRPAISDMIVQGGATLTQRVSDGTVARALAGGEYTALVLQERGGDLICSFGPESCADSRAAIQTLAHLANQKGVSVVLLGTYQPNPVASQDLVEKEAAAAKEAGILYVEVSEKLRKLRSVAPELTWFASDGMHPGRDLALLNAVLVHQALHDSLPRADLLIVAAPVYGTTSGLTEDLRRADDPPPLLDTPSEVQYTSDTLEKLLNIISSTGSS